MNAIDTCYSILATCNDKLCRRRIILSGKCREKFGEEAYAMK